MNDFYFLLSALSGVSPSADAKMYPTFFKYGWQRAEGDEHSAVTIIWIYTGSIQELPQSGRMQLEDEVLF